MFIARIDCTYIGQKAGHDLEMSEGELFVGNLGSLCYANYATCSGLVLMYKIASLEDRGSRYLQTLTESFHEHV